MKLRLVPARTGAAWVRQGLKAFAAQPMGFFSLFMMFMGATAVLSSLPVLGGLFGFILMPAVSLALTVATEKVDAARSAQTKAAAPAVFIAALGAVRMRMRPLAVLGVLLTACVFAMHLLASLFDDPRLASLMLPDGTPNMEVLQSDAVVKAFWLRAVLYAPISLLFWHAPALVHWHQVPVAKSLFFSVVACFRNIGAMTVFALSWMTASFAMAIVLSLVASIAVSINASLGAAVVIGGMLVFTVIFMCTEWFAFRDSFEAD